MIAMPFHPSNTYTIEELNANLMDILDDCEKRAQVSFDGKVDLDLELSLIHILHGFQHFSLPSQSPGVSNEREVVVQPA